jgi:exosome complex component RRP43
MTALQSQPEASSSTSKQGAAAAVVFKRLHPARYLEKFLAEGYRPDGRKVRGWRDVSINVGKFLVILSDT